MTIFYVKDFIHAVMSQNTQLLSEFFTPDARIAWHNSNELFTVQEYIRTNCEYPGCWNGIVERVDETQNGEVVCVSKIWNEEIVCRCVSFIKLIDDKISRLDEYWGDVTEVPEWRRKMNIGETISKAVFK